MGKPETGASHAPRAGSGRRYWVRDIAAPETSTAKPRAKKPPPPGKKRFVEPQRLSEEQRAALLGALEEARIGDAEGRELFAAALEYDLARFRQSEEEPAPAQADAGKSAEPEAALRDLGEAARALAARLAALEAGSREQLQATLSRHDRFHRGYGEAYLESLREELQRIAEAAPAQAAPAKPDKPKAAPLPEATRQFLLRVASAFSDCFELRPTTERGGPFVTTLKAIAKAAGIRLPTDARSLKDVLSVR